MANMSNDDSATLATVIAKDAIRELALLYSRGVDRKDIALLRRLYTRDGIDNHGDLYSGSAEAFCDYLAESLPHVRYSGHHICNHLIDVDGDRATGEIYAIACHVLPDGNGGWAEDIMWVRYCDNYRIEDGAWRFARRDVSFDYRSLRPIELADPAIPEPAADLSYAVLSSPLFARRQAG